MRCLRETLQLLSEMWPIRDMRCPFETCDVCFDHAQHSTAGECHPFLQQLGLAAGFSLVHSLEHGLHVFRHAQHMHIFGSLLEIQLGQCQHVLLPSDLVYFLSEFPYRLQAAHLLVAELDDPFIPRFQH